VSFDILIIVIGEGGLISVFLMEGVQELLTRHLEYLEFHRYLADPSPFISYPIEGDTISGRPAYLLAVEVMAVKLAVDELNATVETGNFNSD
jgi:hypothetical protein